MVNFARRLMIIFLSGILSISPAHAWTENIYECNWLQNFECDIRRDFCVYFQPEILFPFGGFFIASGILANTGLDRTIRDIWQDDVKSKSSDRFFEFPKALGGLSYWYFPLYLSAMGIGYLRECDMYGNVIYQWGYRNLRAFFLGGIQELILAPTLGSGRPSSHQPSKWQPFRYRTGVSGHAFFGGLPLITAAIMTDPPALKTLLYVASTLPGLSRINSDAHYASQVLLGWALALFSAHAVYLSDQARFPTFQMGVCPRKDGAMIAASWRF